MFFHWIKINNSNWADIISILIGSVTSQWLGLSVGRSVGWVVGRSVLKGGKLHTYIHTFIHTNIEASLGRIEKQRHVVSTTFSFAVMYAFRKIFFYLLKDKLLKYFLTINHIMPYNALTNSHMKCGRRTKRLSASLQLSCKSKVLLFLVGIYHSSNLMYTRFNFT